MSHTARLARHVADLPSLLVGYSGGVDSALVAVVAQQTLGSERSLAVLGVSPSLSAAQRRQARYIARRFGLRLLETSTDELADPRYVSNPRNRCFYCKHELWTRLTTIARERGLAVVADGTNASDLGGHRPGRGAGTVFGVRSPLAEVALTKADVRAAARELGIPNWNAPSAPCLASRMRYGLRVTPARLAQVEDAEALLRHLGVEGDLRVRHRGAEARIEILEPEFERVRRLRPRIVKAFRRLGFDRITLDLRGYRSGSLLDSSNELYEYLGDRS